MTTRAPASAANSISPNTYKITGSQKEGWRVHFEPNAAPNFGLEPYYSLLQVIGTVRLNYPDYRPQLTDSQLVDYAYQLDKHVAKNNAMTSAIDQAAEAL